MMTSRIRCDPQLLIEAAGNAADPAGSRWLDRWRDAGERAASIRADVLAGTDALTEAHVASILGLAVGDDDTIVASSSMPVRDIDSFTTIGLKASVLSNRGINGIDGVVSTAIGAARASSVGRVLVHIGDVAALHDIGGILDAVRQNIPLTIVLPNNDGGGIFSFLPAREALDAATFQSLFHAPHGTTFDFLGQHRGVHHEQVLKGLSDAITSAAERPGVSILEVRVSTPERLALQTRLVEAIRAA
jgi:2-succinyl-5-enolpyruvyl-6-hydroxy-3-cyclohexene-1-carboxylate synthase